MTVRQRRWTRVTAYGLMAVAGAAAIAWPTPSVRAATSGFLVLVWGSMLVVGGVSSALGAALDRWLGEYVGLLPLIATWAVYAISALATGRITAIAGAAALGAVAFLLVARWRDVSLTRREAARFHAEHDGR